MSIKSIYKKVLYGYKSSSQSYINYLRKKGVTIGDNVSFYEPNTNYIDTQKPWLIKIGNNVEITRGVVIITHDYAWSVIKQLDGEIIGSRGEVSIGNNVFIGMNTVILNGVKIGNNVIIGANSLINKDVPDNSVIAGNPAKVISDITTYKEKRKGKYVKEAEEMFISYYKQYKKVPKKDLFDEFFWIFEERDYSNLPKAFITKIGLTGNGEVTKSKFLQSDPYFKGYEEFVKYCMEQIERSNS